MISADILIKSDYLPAGRKFHDVASRRPKANNERNPAATEDAQHGAAPAVIGARRFDNAHPVAELPRDVHRTRHAWQQDRDFAFEVDAPAPLNQLRLVPTLIIFVVVSIASIRLVSIRRIRRATSIERVVVTSAVRVLFIVAIRIAFYITIRDSILMVVRPVVSAPPPSVILLPGGTLSGVWLALRLRRAVEGDGRFWRWRHLRLRFRRNRNRSRRGCRRNGCPRRGFVVGCR